MPPPKPADRGRRQAGPGPASRPPDRYRPPRGPVQRAGLVAVAVLAYAGAAALTAVALLDLSRWGVLGSGALGLLVALLVVVGRGALASGRASAPTGGAPAAPAQGGPRRRR